MTTHQNNVQIALHKTATGGQHSAKLQNGNQVLEWDSRNVLSKRKLDKKRAAEKIV